MTDCPQQRYHLTIGTCRLGTIFSIGAARDEEAISKAARIVEHFEAGDAEFHLERANGSTVPLTELRDRVQADSVAA